MLAWTVALALAGAHAAGSPPLRFQLAKIEITSPEALPLGGYTARGGRIAEPGGDPLYARVLILSQGNAKLAIVSAEMLTIPESLIREVQRKVDMPVFLAATHTHCAPDSQLLNDRMTFSLPGIAKFEARWLRWYSDRIAEGVRAAQTAPPTSIDTLAAHLWHTSSNRGRRRLAEPDTAATTIWANRKPLLFHYSAHAVFYGPERNLTSGDWPGQTERIAFLTLVGSIGDVSPAADGATPTEKISKFWETQESGAKQAKQIPIETHPLAMVSTAIRLPASASGATFAKENRIPESLAQSIVGRFAPKEANVTAFRIGKLCVLGVPGEPTSALGRRIRDEGRRLGFEPVLVCSHVNGWAGYILEPDDFARGGYEASLDFYGPEMAERLFAASKAAMLELRSSSRHAYALGSIR